MGRRRAGGYRKSVGPDIPTGKVMHERGFRMKDGYRIGRNSKKMVSGLVAAVLLMSGTAAFPAGAQTGALPVIEYGALEELVKAYNPQVQTRRAGQDRWLEAYQEARDEIMTSRDDLRDRARELKDDGETERAAHYMEQAKLLKGSADQLDKQIRSLNSASNNMDIRHAEDMAAMSAQDVMASWNSLKLDLDSAGAQLEEAAYKKDLADRQLGLGMGTQADADQLENARQAAENKVRSTQGEMDRMQRELCMLTGYEADAQVEIGSLPAPDLERAGGLDLEADQKTAWGNSYDLRQQRHGNSHGTIKQRHSRERTAWSQEQDMYTRLTALYQQVQTALTSCRAAEAAYEAAQLDWKAARHKMDLGTMNRGDYLKAQTEYMQLRAKSGQAEIDLLEAMQRYDWAVKGLTVDAT